MIYANRHEAGRLLAATLEHLRGEEPVVLALPRGGVVVGYQVAKALGAALDVLVVLTVAAPGAGEKAVGAVAPDTISLDKQAISGLGISRHYLATAVGRERLELIQRERVYRAERGPVDVEGRTVILVDDGVATGFTAETAVASLRRRKPARILFAAPVCSAEGAERLGRLVDGLICDHVPDDLRSVGMWYLDFTRVTDGEVIECLRAANTRRIPA